MEKNKAVTAGWFEIPVTDMKRAITFYGNVFSAELSEQDFGGTKMAFFPWDESATGAGGALIDADDHYKPSHEGSLVYFSSDDLADELSRIEKAGGKILQPKTEISPEIGFMGIFEDTEGNRVALHSRQ